VPDKFEQIKLAQESEEETKKTKGQELAAQTEAEERRIKGLKPFLETLGKRRINLFFSPEVETLAFDHQTSSVLINLDFLKKAGLNYEEIDFCLAHEIGHLIQLCRDPKYYLRIFDFIEECAQEKGQSEKGKKILEHIYHNFYNVLLDINDNEIIRSELVPYHPREGSKADLPPRLYREKLFSPQKGKEYPDYSQNPFYAQFLSYLLRKVMSGEESIVSPEVKKALETKISVFGENLSPEEFITKYIQPRASTCQDIFILSKQFLLPLFEKLVEEDKRAGRLKVIEIIKIIDGKSAKKTSQEYRKAAKKILEDEKEAKKSSKEKMKEFAKNQFRKSLEKKGFSKREIKTLEEIRESCQEEVAKLAQVWHSFMRVVTEIQLEKERRHKKGRKINIQDLILQWHKLLTKPQELEIMERDVPTFKEYLLPKKIIINLVLDLSGSMTDEKREEVQKIAYTVASSLKKFEAEVLYQFQKEEVIKTRTDFIGFGTNTDKLPFRASGDEERDFYQAILDIEEDLGRTNDAEALSLALEKFSPADIENIKKGEVLGIILEITDGETQTGSQSKQIVSQINQAGIFCRGIQIPGDIIAEIPPEEKEKRIREGKPWRELIPPSGTFFEVWQDKGLRIDHISQLKKIILKLLEEAIETRS
jgi:hypothetical protein